MKQNSISSEASVLYIDDAIFLLNNSKCISRNFMIVAIILTSMLLLATHDATAQIAKTSDKVQADYVCDSDCPNQPFDPINKTDVAIFNFAGCTWEVEYWYRHTDGCETGTFCDIQLRSVTSTSTPPCTTLTVAQIFTAAAFQAMKHALQNGKPHESCVPEFPNCKTNWRVEAGSCWTRSFQMIQPSSPPEAPAYPWHRVGPCAAEENCCYQSFTVCEDQYGNYVITQTGGGSSGTQCTSPCVKICGQ